MTTDSAKTRLHEIDAALTEAAIPLSRAKIALDALYAELVAPPPIDPGQPTDPGDPPTDPGTPTDPTEPTDPEPGPGPLLSLVSGSPTFRETDKDRPIRLTVTREGELAGVVAARWTVIQGAEQLATGQPTEGRVEVPDGQPSAPLDLMLRGDATPEADALLVVTLSDPEGATLGQPTVQVVIVDDDTALPGLQPHPLFPDWVKLKPRSGRLVAGGPTFWGSKWGLYEQEVAYIDGFGGGNFGTGRARTATLELMSGGPLDRPHQVNPGGQYAVMSVEGNFASPFREHRPNTCWVVHVFETIPKPFYSYEKMAGYLQQVADGKFDRYFWNMGIRTADFLAARQIDPRLYIGRNDHEVQQDGLRPVSKMLWKRAQERIHKQIRRGARAQGVSVDLHFAHAPAKERVIDVGGGPEDFGPIDSWMPETCDMISLSFHPNANVRTRADYEAFSHGTPRLYGLYTDVVECSKKHGIPIGVLEWSPQSEACPIADQVYRWFHDEFLIPNADRLIVELVHHWATITPNATDNNPRMSPAGKAAWRRGVSVFKDLWGGKRPAQAR